MDVRGWYEADALMADLTVHHHTMAGGSEQEIEQRMADRYPNAVADGSHCVRLDPCMPGQPQNTD